VLRADKRAIARRHRRLVMPFVITLVNALSGGDVRASAPLGAIRRSVRVMSLRFFPVVRVRREATLRKSGIGSVVTHTLRPSRVHAAAVVAAFELKNDEQKFARELLTQKTHLWLYRVSQRAFSGDFVVVDASSPRKDRRRVFVIDLKRGAKVRVGGGGAGEQLKNASRVVRLLVERGVIDEETPYELATGDADELLRLIGS
jgi:hypothetical protein